MEEVTVSSKYQVVIPLRVRKKLGVIPGQKIRVIMYENRVELIPLRPIQEARGSLKGINTIIERDEEERV